jgi:hypothetical protein
MKKSESIIEISKALNLLGAELGNVEKNQKNPFFNSTYADLASILNYVKPELAKHGLSIVQSARQADNNHIIVETLLSHVSGEWIETEVYIPTTANNRNDAQTTGSAFTYGRRYGLSAILNISSENDTDGNDLINSGEQTSKLDFNVIAASLKTIELSKDIDNYFEELKNKFNMSTKQHDALVNIFDKRKREIGG